MQNRDTRTMGRHILSSTGQKLHLNVLLQISFISDPPCFGGQKAATAVIFLSTCEHLHPAVDNSLNTHLGLPEQEPKPVSGDDSRALVPN